MQNKILPEEQKGCRRNTKGCKDQLLTNKMIIEKAKMKKKDLSIAWIDYKKAYDSIPHSWIKRCLQIYKLSPIIREFIESTMNNWKTEMQLFYNNGSIKTRKIIIKRGIFQGDSLSPLLFCLGLTPLSKMLNREKIGYAVESNKKINHLLYMDDVKVFAKNDLQLGQIINIIKEFSDDIHMQFGLDKCAKITIKKGKYIAGENIILNEQEQIQNLEQGEMYKYLGVHENTEIQQHKMKMNIKKEYFRRSRLVLKTELNLKNKIKALNSLAIPVVQYSFGVIDWKMQEIKSMDRKTRKILTMHGLHHPKADVERLYIQRREGGRGLIELEAAYKTAIIGLCDYIKFANDRYIEMVKLHENTKPKYSIIKIGEKIANHYNCNKIDERKIFFIKQAIAQEKEELLNMKPLHGQFQRELKKTYVDHKLTNGWLKSAGLKGETESLIIAAQD